MSTESKIGTGLACVGIAVAIGQWLILPEAISYEVRFNMVLTAVVLCVAGIFMICQAAWQRYRGSSADQIKTKPENLTPDGFMSLPEAVRKLHDAAKQGKIPMMGAETLSGGSEEDIYTWWAIRIAKDDDIDLYGRRPPGALEKISSRIKKDFLFIDKARRLKDPINDEIYYEDLRVKTDQLTESYYFEAGFHQD